MKSSKSPFKRFSHSREGSTDENGPSFHKRSISGSSVHNGSHSRNASNSNAPPISGIKTSHKRNTSTSSRASQNSNFLAEQYERDRRAIISCCFSVKDGKSHVSPNNYITHVRIIEDSKSPSSRPPPDSTLENKKKRVLILSCKPTNPNAIQLHKGRENSEGIFQIGRTWDLKELTRIEGDTQISEGFTFTMGKKYYWETNSAKERIVFLKSLINTYMQAFEGHVPELVNWDLSMFYLDEKSYQRAVIHQGGPVRKLSTATNETKIGSLKEGAQISADRLNSPGSSQRQEPIIGQERPSSKQSNFSLNKPPYSNSPTIIEANKRYDSSQDQNLWKEQASKSIEHSPHIAENPFIVAGVEGLSGLAGASEAIGTTVMADAIGAVTPVSLASKKDGSLKPPSPKKQYASQELYHNNKEATTIEGYDGNEYQLGGYSSNSNKNGNLLENLNNVLGSDQKSSEAVTRQKEEKIDLEESSSFDQNIHQSVAKVESLDLNEECEPIDGYHELEDFNATISDAEERRSLEETYEDINELSFEKGDEIRYSQVIDLEKSHMYHEVSTIQEEASSVQNTDKGKKAQVSSANEISKKDKNSPGKSWDIDDEEMLEILTDLNWEMDDDADKLIERLNKKMAETEYTFNKGLLSLENLGPSLIPFEEKVDEECNKMNPILSLFLMEMGNVADDIEYVEGQKNGLQVESANKKLLWDTLTELMNTVSLDDDTLNQLLNTPVSEKNLEKMESQLVVLFKALKAISGERDERGYNLGEMKALHQRRDTYEKVTIRFVERLVKEMNGKFANISHGELSEDHLTSLLTRLLCYSSLVLFCKDISPESYHVLIEKWNTFISGIYNKMSDKIITGLEKLRENSSIKEQRTITNQPGLDRLLLHWAEKKKDVATATIPNENVLLKLGDSMETLKRWCIFYQNFIDSFFHVSSSVTYEQYINQFPDPRSRIVSLENLKTLQSDRESASRESQLVGKIFQPVIAKISTRMIDILKNDRCLAPAVMVTLEQEIKSLESSNAEFLLTALSRIFMQIKQLWSEYIDEEVVNIQRITMNFSSRILSPAVIGLTIFVKNSQELIAIAEKTFDIRDDSSFEAVEVFEDACGKLSSSIVNLLNTKPGAKNTIANDQQSSPSSSSDIDRTITLLINTDWLFEMLSIVNSEGNFDSTIHVAKKIFDTEKDSYAIHLLRASMPKLTSFVDGATNLSANTRSGQTADPSNWAAYSRNNLDNILAGYSSHEIEVLVKRLHDHMGSHFANEPDNRMKDAICEKLWSCMQGHTVSLYLKLYTLIEKHYKGTYIKFTKNDIIAAFESYKK